MMKGASTSLAVFVLLCVGAANCSIWSVTCGVIGNNGIYELKDLGQSSWKVNMSSSNISNLANYLYPTNETLEFGICYSITTCNDTTSSTWANDYLNGTCTGPLTSKGTPSYGIVVNSSTKADMVRINYTGMGYTCNATNSSFNLVVDVVCNHNIDREHAVPVLLANKSCTYQYLLEVNDACPKVDLSVIFTFINKYLVIFCIGFIVLGIIIGLFGRSMWTTIIFLLFSLTITMLFLVVLYEYVLPFNSPDWALWFIMLISCAMGIGLGFVVARYQAAGFILLGVWLGASFTFIFESLIIRILVAAFLVYKVWNKKRKFGIVLAAGLVIIPSIYSFFPNTYTIWVSLIGMSVLCGGISYVLKDLLVTIATSFIGAYLAIRGLSFALGNFPSEYDIYRQITNGKLDYSNTLMVYAFIIALLAVVFIFAQEYLNKEEKEESDEERYKSLELV